MTGRKDFVDLGLPSGTLWAAQNAPMAGNVAPSGSLPTMRQFDELFSVCEAGLADEGVKLTAPNGKDLILPFEGWTVAGKTSKEGESIAFGTVEGGKGRGYYWTREAADCGARMCMRIAGSGYGFISAGGSYHMSIRQVLVQAEPKKRGRKKAGKTATPLP